MSNPGTLARRRIPLLDLQAQYRHIREEVLSAVARVIDSQQFILGEDVRALECEIAAYSNARFGVGCGSGTDALFLALLAAGVGEGDEVLTTPYSFFATAGAIHLVGARPVFVDVEAATFNMDMDLVPAALEKRPRIKAIIPIHLFGGCADMDRLRELAGGRFMVIEDAAQSLGAEYKERRAGSLGEIACFSFYPTKNLGAYGDGGMLTTSDPVLYERLAAFRVHGSRRKYHHDWVGINSRLDSLQAAVLRVKLQYLDAWSNARTRNASRYRELLEGVPITLPAPASYQTRHIFNQFCIATAQRDELRLYLDQCGIGTEVYYPVPLHLQACFASLGYRRGDFPVSERLAGESLALPIHPELSPEDIGYVCDSLKAFFG